MRRMIIAYILLALPSPLLVLFYGLFLLFGSARTFPGRFPRAHRWYRLPLPREAARCSDGSAYSIYLKKGSGNKLVVFFSGGGMSWNAYTAARPYTLRRILTGDIYYYPRVSRYQELLRGGMMLPGDKRNPFKDWNILYIPYASADLHTGDARFPYRDLRGREKVLYHEGVRNVAAALAAAQPIFGPPEQLLIAGDSAGAISCLAQAPNVLRHFPCARVAVYSDSGQLYSPKWQEIIRDVWHADPRLVDCLADGNLLTNWFRLLRGQLGDDVEYLLSCSIYDETLASYQNKLNYDRYARSKQALLEFNQHLNETVTALSRELPAFHYFLSEQSKKASDGSTAHTAACFPWFYRKTAQGVSVAEWLNDAVNSAKPYNVGRELLALAASSAPEPAASEAQVGRA
ncbi:MAG: pectin acetylesterase-family hydrolase [Anaerolineae bacterium]